MLIASLCAIVVTMLLALGRALLGPTVFDRILAANTFSTKTMLLIAVLGFFTDRPEFLDLALAYALINFVGAVAVLKFVRYGNFAQAEIEVEMPRDPDEVRT
jgi:multicomponent Na+:H+ antiporter subunit F